MSRITGVGFSNFRVFKNSTFFNLAPISIFTGTNSSGKSSVFKGLKLLNNNYQDIGFLNFSGEGHKLGTFNQAKSRDSNSNTIRIIFELNHAFLLIIDYNPWKKENGYWNNFMVTIGTEYKEVYEDEELILRIRHIEEDPYLYVFFNMCFLIKKHLKDSNNSNSEDIIKKHGKLEKVNFNATSPSELINKIPSLNSNEAEILATELEAFIINFLSKRVIDPRKSEVVVDKTIFQILAELKIGEKEISERLSSANFKDGINNSLLGQDILFQLESISVLNLINKGFIPNIEWLIKTEIDFFIASISKAINGIHYLEAIRANSQRLYSNQSQGTYFNTQLLELGNIESLPFVQKWLKKFGIGEKLIINRIKGIATEVKVEKEGEEVDLIDLGYGVTQLLPIILYVCSRFNYKLNNNRISLDELFNETETKTTEPTEKNLIFPENGPLLLIEEPEANLHPKLQSLLADFFVDVVKNYKVTLLLETHSEYLIRRMQVLTAAKQLNPKDTVIYYLNGNKEKQEQDFVTTINIKPDGSLTNDFGPGFIDEATNWKLELMRLKNAQLKNLN